LAVEDAQAFVAGLARTHGEELRRFLNPRVRNVADVPDVIQEVFLRMLRIPEREAIRSPESLSLHGRLARGPSSTRCANHARRPYVEVSELVTHLRAAADTDPAMQANAEQCLEGFIRALERLSPKVRATFVLHRQYGLTLTQISGELGISFAMAKSTWSRRSSSSASTWDLAE